MGRIAQFVLLTPVAQSMNQLYYFKTFPRMQRWVVDDAVAKDLTRDYYIYLKQGETKDSALREAKLKLMKRNSFGHPFFWANFIPVGDMSPIK